MAKQSREWPITLDYPQIWLPVFALAIWLIGRVLPSGADLFVALGWLLVLAALALMVWSAQHFRLARTSINPHGQPDALITGGPFRFSRNPIYLADAMILIGFCLAWRALPTLILIPVFVWLINRRYIVKEEARLTAAFPETYPAYTQRVRRWL
ncbi:methyltransferase family protein [Paracoccus tegillarcae]|nr:isoprenylcysteine carboxylmethyltransferase family protein [Paracoccus tegillarcae]